MVFFAFVGTILSILTIVLVRNSYQFQPFTVQNHILPKGKTLRSFSTDWFGCVESCSQDLKCASYNYWFADNSEDTKDGICDLNSCGVSQQCGNANSRKNLVFQNGAIYQQLREIQVWCHFICV